MDKVFSPQNASNLPLLKNPAHSLKTNFSSFKAKSVARMPVKAKVSQSNQYGDFYKNLMKPYGG